MHLHGHHAVVLSRDGEKATRQPVVVRLPRGARRRDLRGRVRRRQPRHLDGPLPQPQARRRGPGHAPDVRRRHHPVPARRWTPATCRSDGRRGAADSLRRVTDPPDEPPSRAHRRPRLRPGRRRPGRAHRRPGGRLRRGQDPRAGRRDPAHPARAAPRPGGARHPAVRRGRRAVVRAELPEAAVDDVARAATLGPLPDGARPGRGDQRRHLRRPGGRRGRADRGACTAPGVERIEDVGVAGLHRLLEVRDRFAEADCLVVVAGMEGALPSVVGGLTGVPLVAVPTSVGYGASFGGLAALLGDAELLRARASRWSTSTTATAPASSPPGWPATHGPGDRGPRPEPRDRLGRRLLGRQRRHAARRPGRRRRPARRDGRGGRQGRPGAGRAATVEHVRRGGLRRHPVPRRGRRHAAPHRTWRDVERAARRRRPARGRPRRSPTTCSPGSPRPRAAVHGTAPERGALPRGRRARRDRRRRRGLRRRGPPRRSTALVVSDVSVGGGTVQQRARPPAGPAAGGGRAAARGARRYGGPVDLELCTPTGAALLTTLADDWGPQPAMAVDRGRRRRGRPRPGGARQRAAAARRARSRPARPRGSTGQRRSAACSRPTSTTSTRGSGRS